MAFSLHMSAMGALYDSSTLRCSVVDITHSFIAPCILYMYTKPYLSTRSVESTFSIGVLPAKWCKSY